MYTGIIKGKGIVSAVEARAGLKTYTIEIPSELMAGVEQGASVGIDGVCLTVTEFDRSSAKFDVMQETLNRTTLGDLKVGDEVNIERSAKDGAEIGGHPISGHVDCTAKILQIETPENNYVLTFKVEPEWMKYIFQKGFVALNGASLTISGVDKANNTFKVWFIPETLRLTTFGQKKIGDRINLEIERSTQVMVDTVIDFLVERLGELSENLAIQRLL